MANYDVYCGNCDKIMEMNIPIADYEKPAYCPVCNEPHQVMRVFLQAPSFIMKRVIHKELK